MSKGDASVVKNWGLETDNFKKSLNVTTCSAIFSWKEEIHGALYNEERQNIELVDNFIVDNQNWKLKPHYANGLVKTSFGCHGVQRQQDKMYQHP